MTLWAIAYTLDSEGRPRKSGPYIFPDTISYTRREAWKSWVKDDGLGKELRKKRGAKAIKVKLEVNE